jgi:hypothetical protein
MGGMSSSSPTSSHAVGTIQYGDPERPPQRQPDDDHREQPERHEGSHGDERGHGGSFDRVRSRGRRRAHPVRIGAGRARPRHPFRRRVGDADQG